MLINTTRDFQQGVKDKTSVGYNQKSEIIAEEPLAKTTYSASKMLPRIGCLSRALFYYCEDVLGQYFESLAKGIGCRQEDRPYSVDSQ